MKRKLLSFLLIIGTIIITVGILYIILTAEKEIKAVSPEVERTVAVEIDKVTSKDFVHYLDLLGTVYPIRKSEISSEVAGQIQSIESEVEIGKFVKKDQVLAVIKDTSFKINLERKQALLEKFKALYEIEKIQHKDRETQLNIAQEKLNLTETEYQRKRALQEKGFISEQELDNVRLRYEEARSNFQRAKTVFMSSEATLKATKADVASAQAEIEQEREMWGNTRLRAPFDGIITEKMIDLGMQVVPGQKLFSLVDVSSVKILVKVPATDIGYIQIGQPAEIFVESYKDLTFEGTVENIGVEADLNNRRFPVEVLVQNDHAKKLLPGMFARVKIRAQNYPNAILVSRDLILSSNGDHYVYVADLDKGVAIKRKVQIGQRFEELYLIEEGLKENESVIKVGYRSLHDGAKITVVNGSQP